MFTYYQMTHLEEFVEGVYARHKITSPEQITVNELSYRLNVWLYYSEVRSRALEASSGMYSMFLDSRLPTEEQRTEFLHELCHLLRHAGNQMVMPEQFTRAQEIETEHFVLYAVMPFSMISRFPIPDHRSKALSYIVETFRVPADLAEQRLDQIQRRTLQGLMNATVRDYERELRYKEPRWSSETKRILKQLDKQLIAKGLAQYEDHGLL